MLTLPMYPEHVRATMAGDKITTMRRQVIPCGFRLMRQDGKAISRCLIVPVPCPALWLDRLSPAEFSNLAALEGYYQREAEFRAVLARIYPAAERGDEPLHLHGLLKVARASATAEMFSDYEHNELKPL